MLSNSQKWYLEELLARDFDDTMYNLNMAIDDYTGGYIDVDELEPGLAELEANVTCMRDILGDSFARPYIAEYNKIHTSIYNKR